jgi:uncharacterized protein (DUF934 family)
VPRATLIDSAGIAHLAIEFPLDTGFDAFAVKPSHDPQAALGTFTVHHQTTYPPVATTATAATSRPAAR